MTSNDDRPLGPYPERAPIQDRRPRPKGVIPRRLQMWLMVGIAVVILFVILITGQPEPSTGVRLADAVEPAPIQPERVRSYQERVAEQEARIRQETAEANEPLPPPAPPTAAAPVDPIADERRRRDFQSLFADNVAYSRRGEGDRPYAFPPNEGPAGGPPGQSFPVSSMAALASLQSLAPFPQAVTMAPQPQPQPLAPASATSPTSDRLAGNPERPNAGASPDSPASSRRTDPIPASGPEHRLLEGTVIEAVLLNRLDGTFSGPVQCLVTTPVYSHSRQQVLVPAGARVLGSAAPVQSWGDSRLAIQFHRLVMPDGRTYSLDEFKGMNQIGETGLTDEVNRHYMQVFGASIAIGALSGLAQFNTRGGFDSYSFGDASRQGTGASLATSTARVLDRYLNVLPTITIREGHRIKVVLTSDLDLPTYSDASNATATVRTMGGTR